MASKLSKNPRLNNQLTKKKLIWAPWNANNPAGHVSFKFISGGKKGGFEHKNGLVLDKMLQIIHYLMKNS